MACGDGQTTLQNHYAVFGVGLPSTRGSFSDFILQQWERSGENDAANALLLLSQRPKTAKAASCFGSIDHSEHLREELQGL